MRICTCQHSIHDHADDGCWLTDCECREYTAIVVNPCPSPGCKGDVTMGCQQGTNFGIRCHECGLGMIEILSDEWPPGVKPGDWNSSCIWTTLRTLKRWNTLPQPPRRNEIALGTAAAESSKVLKPNVTTINWGQISPKVSSHAMCRYCDSRGSFMRHRGKGVYELLCPDHAYERKQSK